ncbi:MAG TPA: membrane dipeptidase [Acidimicrobiales bacterium]|jgi:membrane dipeptidase|nr:membrane dipeptidase [Acidimicrobiales bacterium]
MRPRREPILSPELIRDDDRPEVDLGPGPTLHARSSIREDPSGWAARLGVGLDAVQDYMACDVVDLHVESFIWTRVFRYDLQRWHAHTALGGRLFGQADLPRMRAVGLSGVVMSVATNPFRSAAGRRRACVHNLARLRAALDQPGTAVVADAAGYDRARAAGDLACFIALQGANAVRPEHLADPAFDVVSRITLMHLTRSRYGTTSAPGGRRGGLRAEGRNVIAAMRARAILLDLAHASPRTFWDALEAHGRDAPVIVSHTGAGAVCRSWRNLDDEQIRAIAHTGGVVGIILQRSFLAHPGWRASADDVVAHMEHVIRIGGEAAAAIGSDYDGFIVPPRDLATVTALPRLVQRMHDRGWSAARVAAVLGANALQVMRAVRPGADR